MCVQLFGIKTAFYFQLHLLLTKENRQLILIFLIELYMNQDALSNDRSWTSFSVTWPLMSPCQYRKSHCDDETIIRLSYIHNCISNAGKMTSLYWTRAQITLKLILEPLWYLVTSKQFCGWRLEINILFHRWPYCRYKNIHWIAHNVALSSDLEIVI